MAFENMCFYFYPNMLSFIIFIHLIFTNINSQNICMWGRKGTNSPMINGEFMYQGIYNAAPYYKKIIDPSYAPYNITYLWQYVGSYFFTDGPPNTTLSIYRGKCNIPSADPISCGSNWGVPTTTDTNVFAQNAPCPQWNCDRVVTNDIGNSCDQNFNIKIAPNAWSNAAGNRYWYYNYNIPEWVCAETYELKHGSPYALTNDTWKYTKKGTSVDLLFRFPDTNTHTIQCIDDNPPTAAPTALTSNPSVAPTFNPTHLPTIYPTSIPTHLPTIDPTIDPTSNPTYNPTSLPTNYPTLYPTNNPTHSPQVQNNLIVQNPTINQKEVFESHSTTNVLEVKQEYDSDGLTYADGIIYIVLGVVISCCVMSLLIAVIIGYCFWKHKLRNTSETNGRKNKSISIEIPKLSIKKLSDGTSPKVKLTDHDSLQFVPEELIKMDNTPFEDVNTVGNIQMNLHVTDSEQIYKNPQIQMFDIHNTPGMVVQQLPDSPDIDSINIPPGTVNSRTQNTDGSHLDQIINAAHLDQIIDSESSQKIKIDLAVTESEMSDGMYQTPKDNAIKMFSATPTPMNIIT